VRILRRGGLGVLLPGRCSCPLCADEQVNWARIKGGLQIEFAHGAK
jgi:hypothetical protein